MRAELERVDPSVRRGQTTVEGRHCGGPERLSGASVIYDSISGLGLCRALYRGPCWPCCQRTIYVETTMFGMISSIGNVKKFLISRCSRQERDSNNGQ